MMIFVRLVLALAGFATASAIAQSVAAPTAVPPAPASVSAADVVSTWKLVSIVKRDPKTGAVSQP
ncbi:MAG: hypothetical protein C0460_10930 [Methylibium sp.]|jgi:hypothetical protein|nr:hypothetical protein [Methylibium sp.]